MKQTKQDQVSEKKHKVDISIVYNECKTMNGKCVSKRASCRNSRNHAYWIGAAWAYTNIMKLIENGKRNE